MRTSFSYWWRWLQQTAPGKLGPPCSQFCSTDELLSQVPFRDHQISVVRASDRGLEQETFHVILIMDHVEVASAHRVVMEYGVCKLGTFLHTKEIGLL